MSSLVKSGSLIYEYWFSPVVGNRGWLVKNYSGQLHTATLDSLSLKKTFPVGDWAKRSSLRFCTYEQATRVFVGCNEGFSSPAFTFERNAPQSCPLALARITFVKKLKRSKTGQTPQGKRNFCPCGVT